MKRIIKILAFATLTCLGCLTFSDVAFAQTANTDLDVQITAPANWETKQDEMNSERCAVYVDPKSEHRIEVMVRRNTRTKHAEALFMAFNEKLRENLDVHSNIAKTYDLTGGVTRKGQYVEYKTRESNVPLSVVTFAFTTEETAYIIVGYFANAKREEGINAFDSFIRSMVDVQPAS